MPGNQQLLRIRPFILEQLSAIQAVGNGSCIAIESRGSHNPKMTLRIQRDSNGDSTTIRLIGRIRSEHLQDLKEQIASAGPRVVLDLDEVTLVDVDGVRFLGACEAAGAELLNCTPYIREWMLREMSGEKR